MRKFESIRVKAQTPEFASTALGIADYRVADHLTMNT
jgi:hypothetical protein